MQMARFVHVYARRSRLVLPWLPLVLLVPLPLRLVLALVHLTRTVCEVGRLCILSCTALHCTARFIYHLLFLNSRCWSLKERKESNHTVLEAQFWRLENPKLAFATATSNSDCSPQKVAWSDGIISYKIDYRTESEKSKKSEILTPRFETCKAPLYQGSVRTNDSAGGVYYGYENVKNELLLHMISSLAFEHELCCLFFRSGLLTHLKKCCHALAPFSSFTPAFPSPPVTDAWVSSIYHTPPCFRLGQLAWFHLQVVNEYM
jgi:hypothetical protein